MSGPSVVIVGGGACGLSAAMHLTRLGIADVTVIEQDHLATGSTGLTIGNVPGVWQDPLDVELRARSLRQFEELEAEIGLKWTGNVRMSLDPADEDVFQRSVAAQEPFGMGARLVDHDELQRIVPDMRCDDVAVALYMERAGHVDGHLLCEAYAQRATAAGATIRPRTALLGASEARGGGHHLETTTGAIECDVVVNAAGAWASRVGKMLGTTAPVTPYRHEIYVVQTSKEIDYNMPQVGEALARRDGVTGSGLYFQKEGSRSLLVGVHTGGFEHGETADPDSYHRGLMNGGEMPVAQALIDRLPGFEDLSLKGGWAGLYPTSPDDRPQVGPCNRDGSVISVCGVGGWGVQASPAIGEIAAEWIVHGASRTVPAATEFLPSRFDA